MDLFTHESRTLRTLADQGYTPAVIYDIGASNGVWSDTIALTLPHAEYHLFEPLVDAVPFYRQDLEERLARQPKFHVHAVALSDHSGTADVFATHDGFGSSILDRGAVPELREKVRALVKEKVRVPLHTLDEIVESQCLPEPDVMKLDVQGAERLILAGGRRAMQSANILFLETWLARGYGPDTPLLPEMIEFLGEAGFTLVDLGEQFRDERQRVYAVDAVFLSDRFLSTRYRRAGPEPA
jgi:FkbM family methyltransferase